MSMVPSSSSSPAESRRPGPTQQPAVIPIQPEPIDWQVLYVPGWSIIARVFDPRDIARCRLCPTCRATKQGLCTLAVDREVDPSAGRLFSLSEALVGPESGRVAYRYLGAT